tara:strand:- start:752 stop:1093 length:342 start_codon:yes stop_codon:yes gene_type:complete
MKIYHNPRCKKSRDTLAILEEKNIEKEIILYLKNPPGSKELTKILDLLKMTPLELIRKEEKIFKEKIKGQKFTNDDYIEMMCKFPILIQRPIIIKNGRAVIGRPPIKVLDLLK